MDVKHVSGPLRVAAAYALSSRLSGVTLLAGSTQSDAAASSRSSASPRRFTTPFDLMVYGFNPVIPAPGPRQGTTWRSSRTSP